MRRYSAPGIVFLLDNEFQQNILALQYRIPFELSAPEPGFILKFHQAVCCAGKDRTGALPQGCAGCVQNSFKVSGCRASGYGGQRFCCFGWIIAGMHILIPNLYSSVNYIES